MSVIEGLIAVGLTGCVIYLAAAQLPVPDAIKVGFGTIIGYFFSDTARRVGVRQVFEVLENNKRGVPGNGKVQSD